MLIDSVVIKLNRTGGSDNPCYTLELYGNGKVVYDGLKNVKVKGVVEDKISEDDFIGLLSDLKQSGFFSNKVKFDTDEDLSESIVGLSVSFRDKDDKIVSKTISHSVKDDSVPDSIKDVENKIDIVADSSKWVSKDLVKEEDESLEEKIDAAILSSKVDKKPEKKVKKVKSKKKEKHIKMVFLKNKRFMLIFLIVLLAILVFAGIYLSGFFDNSEEDKDSPTINKLVTASFVSQDGLYFAQENFSFGETVYVYEEFDNFTVLENGSCDLLLKLKVSSGSSVYYENSYELSAEFYAFKWPFTVDSSWPKGKYRVFCTVVDNLSGRKVSSSTFFYLV